MVLLEFIVWLSVNRGGIGRYLTVTGFILFFRVPSVDIPLDFYSDSYGSGVQILSMITLIIP